MLLNPRQKTTVNYSYQQKSLKSKQYKLISYYIFFNVHHGITIVTIMIVEIQLFLYIVFSLTRYPSDIHSLFCFHFNVLNNKQNNVLRGT